MALFKKSLAGGKGAVTRLMNLTVRAVDDQTIRLDDLDKTIDHLK